MPADKDEGRCTCHEHYDHVGTMQRRDVDSDCPQHGVPVATTPLAMPADNDVHRYASNALAEIKRGRAALRAACENSFHLHASIPARPDEDDDLVISSAFTVAELTIGTLTSALDKAQRERDAMQSVVKQAETAVADGYASKSMREAVIRYRARASTSGVKE
jgi:hypothetical protein